MHKFRMFSKGDIDIIAENVLVSVLQYICLYENSVYVQRADIDILFQDLTLRDSRKTFFALVRL